MKRPHPNQILTNGSLIQTKNTYLGLCYRKSKARNNPLIWHKCDEEKLSNIGFFGYFRALGIEPIGEMSYHHHLKAIDTTE